MQTEEMDTTQQLIKSLVKLNIGSGSNKIDGFINIDSQEENKPDLILDISKSPLPYSTDSVDEIVFFHCIEHIVEKMHDTILREFFRVLKLGGKFIISYPEFLKCSKAYEENFKGQRDFFKATIYGRQSHAGDFHVALMDSQFFKTRLIRLGFECLEIKEESAHEPYNTVVLARKNRPWIEREELLREEIFNS